METLRIFPEQTYQTFERFGVSGAWWAQVVGGWREPDPATGLPKRELAARLLFDPAEGLGIRCYRYNLGAGSAASGKGKFDLACRRAESFDTDGGYDWTRDANAVWMLRRAVALGADEVVFFANSPPERFTRNGKAHLDKPFRTNLAPENYENYANYCLDVVSHFRAEGIPVKYLSPVNEPVWVWTGSQEGCHYRPGQVKKLLRVFARQMDLRPALADLKLSGAENGDIRWFNKTYCRILLDDPIISRRVDAVDTHSYCVTPDFPLVRRLVGDRLPYLKRYRAFLDRHYPGVNVKTSEWTHMRGGRDYGMDSALEQTGVILEDLTVLGVCSWQLWIALSNVDYCDGLIYENDDTRTLELTKRYFAYGNFTKFIAPGSVRCGVAAGQGVQAVAFTKNGRHAAVLMNRGGVKRELALPEGVCAVYVTSETQDLEPVPVKKTLALPPKSVVTVVLEPQGGHMHG